MTSFDRNESSRMQLLCSRRSSIDFGGRSKPGLLFAAICRSAIALLLLGFAAFAHAQTGQIAAGGYHSLALQPNGTLWAWGDNSLGQLGDGTTTSRTRAVPIGSGYTAIAAGLHSVALKSDGSLWTWGYNPDGRLGDGTTINSTAPKQIGTGYKAIAAGSDHTLAIKSDGSLWAWGDNYWGQLGNGTRTNSHVPIRIGTASNWVAVAAGGRFSIALDAEGGLWTWGLNMDRELGDGTTATYRATPLKIATGASAIAAGGFHVAALDSSGGLYAWGDNYYGQLGDGYTGDRGSIYQVGSSYMAAAPGDYHTLGLKSDGSLWSWGDNGWGQLGVGTYTSSLIPKRIGTATDWVAISAVSHSLALKSDGSVWAWGYNEFGQLGNGFTFNRASPSQVLDASGAALNLLTATASYTLKASVTGSGAVASTPSGITCGSSCSAVFSSGTVVTLSAAPAAGYYLTGWSGGGCTGTGDCTVTIDQAQSVSATFALIPLPAVSLSASSLSFGNQVINSTSIAKTVTLSNTGTASLSITSIVASGDFTQTNNCGSTRAVGTSCTINVTFLPKTIAPSAGSLTITNNAAGSPHVIALSGTGVNGLSSISISGPAALDEGTSAGYSIIASYADASTATVAGTLSLGTTSYASLSGATLSAGIVTADQSLSLNASYSEGGVTRTATLAVTIRNTVNLLTGIAIVGPNSMNDGASATYAIAASYDNNTTATVTGSLSLAATPYASLSGNLLSANPVQTNQIVQLNASYTEGAITRTAVMAVQVMAPDTTPNPFSASLLYIPNPDANAVTVVDPVAGAVVDTIKVGLRPVAVAAKSDGSRVYVANRGSNTVSVIDTASNRVISHIGSGVEQLSLALSKDDSSLYVGMLGCVGQSWIFVGQTATETVGRTLPINFPPSQIAADAAGRYVYAVGVDSTCAIRMAIVDQANNYSVVDNITLFAAGCCGDPTKMTEAQVRALGPKGIAVVTTSEGNKVYVSSPAGVLVFNAATNSVSPTRIGSGRDLYGAALSPNASRLYVLEKATGKLLAIDTSSDTIVKEVSVAREPSHVALNADGSRIYVLSYATGVVETYAYDAANEVYQLLSSASGSGAKEDLNGQFAATLRTGFVPKKAAAPGAETVSNAITVSGINRPVGVNLDAGWYRINDETEWTAAGVQRQVTNNDRIQVKVAAAAEADTMLAATLDVAGVAVPFWVTTPFTGADVAPMPAPKFTVQSSVPPASIQISKTIDMSKYVNVGESQKFRIIGSGEYSRNGGPFTTEQGDTTSSDKFVLRAHASSAYGAVQSVMLIVGGRTVRGEFEGGTAAIFPVTTVVSATTVPLADTEPDPFTFNPVINAAPNLPQTSNAIRVSGLYVDSVTGELMRSPISVVNGRYGINTVNPAEFRAYDSFVQNGDTVVVEHTPTGGTTWAELTIGTFAPARFEVTTIPIQVISFGAAPALVVGGSGTVSATGGASGNAVTFSSTTTGVCTVAGTTVSAVSVGTCIIAANQAGNANYATAPQVTQNITVGLGSQSISFGAVSALVVGGSGTVSATGGASGNAVTFSSTTTGVCTISGSTVSAVSAGTCTIAANQAGNANYAAAPQATQNITVGQAAQSINFGAAPALAVGGTGTVSATGGASGNAVTFSSMTTGVCTISGSTVTGVSAGTCTIAANQAGNANYAAAPQVTQNIAVGVAAQSITFGAATALAVGGTGTVSATGGASGNAVTFSSTTPAVCTISGSTVTGVSAGICTIAANQAGNANYAAATQVTQNIAVGVAAQSITFGAATVLAVGGIGTVSATGGASGNAVTFSSTTPAVCTISGSTVSAVSAGTCTIAANQAGNANYAAAPQATQNITVGQSAAVVLDLTSGWNLLGNSSSGTLDTAAVFGDTTKVTTVWKWIASGAKWAFYAPSLAGQSLVDYAAGKGYDVLTSINGGEGFWVNAKLAFTAQLPAGAAVTSDMHRSNLVNGWNLIATGDNKMPSQFNRALSLPPTAETEIPINVTTLWAWDAAQTNWYFYAPSLEKSGGLSGYIQQKSYLDFGVKVLDPGMGFWVNKP